MENSTEAMNSLSDMQKGFQKFGLADYIVFIAMLIGCSAIGLFYAMKSKTKKGGDEAAEYLMGGRQMSVFPISMSLVASFISGITLLGTPTELYLHGTEYIFFTLNMFTTGYLSSYVIIPVFHDLQLSSTYEYLSLRYDNRVRLFGSVLFTVGLICWLPIVIYVPALAFNQVTGVNVHIVTPCVCVVCIFYTCIGGLKAVVWTDVVQTFIMMGAMVLVMIKGTMDLGGLTNLWKPNWLSGRIEFPSFSPDPTIRHSIFTLYIGGTFHLLQAGVVNQNMIQRFLTLPTVASARRALWIYMVGIMLIAFSCGYCGLLAFATYQDCDPLTTGLAKAKDQILPLLVMKTLGDFPGIPGLFVAGVFSAALSSLSTGLNSMAAVFLEDYLKPNISHELSNRTTRIVLRSVVLIFGVICVGLVFVVEKLGSVLQLSMSLGAITNGPAFGLFMGGMFLPSLNAKGALYGGLIGTLVSGIIILGAQQAMAVGDIFYPNKPLSTAGCDYVFNAVSLAPNRTIEASNTFPLYRISYLYYTLIGGICTIVFAVLISYVTGGNDYEKMDPKFFCPFVRGKLQSRATSATLPEEKELLEILRNDQPASRMNSVSEK